MNKISEKFNKLINHLKNVNDAYGTSLQNLDKLINKYRFFVPKKKLEQLLEQEVEIYKNTSNSIKDIRRK